MGLGETPDYTLVLNPRNPVDSYMVVFHQDGRQVQYRLSPPEDDNRKWVIAYASRIENEWPKLSGRPDDLAKAEAREPSFCHHLTRGRMMSMTSGGWR